MPDVTILSVFLLGLFGGLHCAGMCGGIVAVIGASANRAPSRRPSGPEIAIPVVAASSRPAGAWPAMLGYNAGRILSYSAAGAIAGAAGSTAWLLDHQLPVQQAAFVAANLLLIAIGLHLTGALGSVALLEPAGRRLWRALGPLASRLLGADRFPRALAAGVVWGWVPCGMVYGVLIAAILSGSATEGATLMFAFGLGTLPNLLALGWSAHAARRALGHRGLRVAAGLFVIGFGLAGFARIDPLVHLQGVVDACLSVFR